jgi:hypothetical protein
MPCWLGILGLERVSTEARISLSFLGILTKATRRGRLRRHGSVCAEVKAAGILRR